VTFRFAATDRGALTALGADLTRAGGGLRQKVAPAIKQPTKDVHDAVRTAILGADLSGIRTGRQPRFTAHIVSRGVRRPTAKALSWKVSTSAGGAQAEVMFSGAKVPERIQALFPYWVGQKRRLRHPIMGKTRGGAWRGGAGQRIPNVWKAVDELGPKAQAAVAKVMDETAATIAGKG
jgi:hypothetical protein